MLLKISKKYDLIIDDDDFDLINNYHWYYKKCWGKAFYVKGYKKGITKNVKWVSLSRLIMNCPKEKIVDHINHNTLDNRKLNLRICSIQQNAFNQKLRKNSISGYKGVTWHKKTKKWEVYIGYNNKKYHLGLFKNKKIAKESYNKKAIELFGELAFLNK